VTNIDGSGGLGISGQGTQRKGKRDGYICIAQLLNTFGVVNSGGKIFEQCPHGSQCVFDHVRKHDKSKEEMKKAVDLSKGKLLTKVVRRSLLLAIQKS